MRHLGRRLDRLRACFARMPDPRRGDNRRYAMADIGMAALSVFLMQSPSFLAHQRALAEGLAPMRRLDGRVLVALDGTGFFRSRKVRCGNCSTRKRRDGGTEHFHQMLGAHIVAPGRAQSLPLPPEFVAPRDGADKQDCERQAVKRWLARHGERCAALRPVHLGDDLYACQPVCRACQYRSKTPQ